MQISTGQPSADSSLTETSYCLIESVNELMQFLENMFWKKKKEKIYHVSIEFWYKSTGALHVSGTPFSDWLRY